MNLVELGKNPISGDSPGGIDVKYEAEFEALQGEIDKLSIATAESAGCDWNKVVQLSSTILAEKSKNILVAAYLAVGLVKTRELEGLIIGLTVLTDLATNFWETLFPPKKRMRGRINALAWWLDQTESFLQGYNPPPQPPERIKAALEGLKKLDEAISEKSDEAPMITKLNSYVNRLPMEVQEEAPAEAPAPKEAPVKEAVAAKPAPTTPAARSVSTGPSAQAAPVSFDGIKTRPSAEQALKDGLALLTKASDFLLAEDLSNPLPYHLTRITSWLTVDRLPMTDGNKTPIPPPDGMIMSSLQNLFSARDYESAINTAESRVPQFLFWLDLSRVTSNALDQLGGKYQSAREAVDVETAAFLKRLPGLDDLTFSDGTPFADKETRAWIKTIGFGGGQTLAMSGASGSLESEVAETLGKAGGLVKDKKILEAARMIEMNLSRSDSGKARFLWRLALAQLLTGAARSDLARIHLEEILAFIDEFKMESFEPQLALNGLITVYRGLEEIDGEEIKKRVDTVFNRISRLSPSAALSLRKS